MNGKSEVVVITATDPIELGVTDQALADMKKRLGKVAKAPVESTADYQVLTKAIAECRTTRTAIESHRKELKAPVLEYGRKLDAEAARVIGKLQEIEDPLKSKKQEVDEEKARKKAEKAAQEQARVQAVQNQIMEIQRLEIQAPGADQDTLDAMKESLVHIEKDLTKANFQEFIDQAHLAHANARAAVDNRQKALDDWEAEREAREEAEAELKKQQQELKLEQEKLAQEKADQAAREAELAAREKAAQEEAEAKAREEAEARAAAEAEEAEKKAQAAAARKAKRLAPDKALLAGIQEKIAAYILLLLDDDLVKNLKTKEGKAVWKATHEKLEEAASHCCLGDDLPW